MALHQAIKPGRAVDIGDQITVLISRTKGGYRVSIEAPREINIQFRDMTPGERKKMRRRRSQS